MLPQPELMMDPAHTAPAGRGATLRIETGQGDALVFGHWHHVFGCWQVAANGTAAAEVLPRLAPLDDRGPWGQALAPLLAGIPPAIGGAVAGLGEWQWPVLDMVWQVPALAPLLAQDRRDSDGRGLIAVLALSDVRRQSRGARRRLALGLVALGIDGMLRALGIGAPAALRLLLDRVAEPARVPGASLVRDLAAVAADPSRRALAWDLVRLDRGVVAWLAALPPAWLQATPAFAAACGPDPALVEAVVALADRLPAADRPRAYAQLCAAARAAGERAQTGTEGGAEGETGAGTGAGTGLGALLAALAHWQAVAEAAQPFAPPPHPGLGLMTPVVSGADLSDLARACRQPGLLALAPELRAGTVALYRWAGHPVRAVVLRRDEDGHWTADPAWAAAAPESGREPGSGMGREIGAELGAGPAERARRIARGRSSARRVAGAIEALLAA